jgi:hypothetical protein
MTAANFTNSAYIFNKFSRNKNLCVYKTLPRHFPAPYVLFVELFHKCHKTVPLYLGSMLRI